jgi:hypothetical protein
MEEDACPGRAWLLFLLSTFMQVVQALSLQLVWHCPAVALSFPILVLECFQQ